VSVVFVMKGRSRSAIAERLKEGNWSRSFDFMRDKPFNKESDWFVHGIDEELPAWTLREGDRVFNLVDDAVVAGDLYRNGKETKYPRKHPKLIPQGALGTVIDISGESPEDEDATLLVDFEWKEGDHAFSGHYEFNHEKWVRRA
jgi:hypothetical protein